MRQDPTQRLAAARAPGAKVDHPPRVSRLNPVTPQNAITASRSRPRALHVASQSSSHPAVEFTQLSRPLSATVVANPTAQITAQVSHYQWQAPPALGQFPHSLFESRHRLRCYPPPRLGFVRKA